MVEDKALHVLPGTGMNLALAVNLRLPYKVVFRGRDSYMLVYGSEAALRGAERFAGNAPVLTEEDARWARERLDDEMRQRMNGAEAHRSNMRFLVAFGRELEKEKRREGEAHADGENAEEGIQADGEE